MLENNQKGMSLMIECEDCEAKFEINSNNEATSVSHKKEFKVNGQSIFLTYYDCPKCGRRHFVQIDDEVSLAKLEDVKRQFIKLSVMRKKGKEIHKKQSANFKKARKDLSNYRNNLMKEYTDKFIDEGNGLTFRLRFSV